MTHEAPLGNVYFCKRPGTPGNVVSAWAIVSALILKQSAMLLAASILYALKSPNRFVHFRSNSLAACVIFMFTPCVAASEFVLSINPFIVTCSCKPKESAFE